MDVTYREVNGKNIALIIEKIMLISEEDYDEWSVLEEEIEKED